MKTTVQAFVAGLSISISLSLLAEDKIGTAHKVAPNVYFHQGDLDKGHCNQGWIVFKDYVLVVDGNFPSGVEVVLPKIKATTRKSIKFVIDTHHHGDHAYGNMTWFENGAIPVASIGALEEMKKYETGYYGKHPVGRWEWSAKQRPGVKSSKLLPPMLTFEKKLVFDDGTMRVECLYLGNAHTHGDVFVWLPKQRILFSGDACVNGPYNYMGDGNSIDWIKTLNAAKALKPRVMCPGHGAMSDSSLIDDQKAYFSALHTEVKPLAEGKKSIEQVRANVHSMRERIMKNDQIKRYVGKRFGEQIEKIYGDYTGQILGRLDITK
jgi:glyoxylase-like metal-dependent hydrolase (beta-lactamase superfamily II)